MKVGDRVRPSGYQTQQARDRWNNWGREPMKSAARAELDRLIALRGTVTALLPGDKAKGSSPGVRVLTDDGAQHDSLSYLWEVVQE